ncbi:BnaC08g08370D [Brassica napus]|uniref:BnaC08g08370D protein n=2 Tax=Brassica TaxID=3705 RepID=A0A078FJT4_BRANA|nr:BnaC08g08370D [Brassica napus]
MRIKIEKPNDIEHVEPYISFDISDDLCKLVMIHVIGICKPYFLYPRHVGL